MKGVHTVNCSEVIRERRSIRKYKENVTIPQEDFERMLEAAMMAPSACNKTVAVFCGNKQGNDRKA